MAKFQWNTSLSKVRIQIEYWNKVAWCTFTGALEYDDVVLGIHQGRVCLHWYFADCCCCACPPQTLGLIPQLSLTLMHLLDASVSCHLNAF